MELLVIRKLSAPAFRGLAFTYRGITLHGPYEFTTQETATEKLFRIKSTIPGGWDFGEIEINYICDKDDLKFTFDNLVKLLEENRNI